MWAQTMTRAEYLKKLKSYLKNISEEDMADLLVYYEEIFDELGIADTDLVPSHITGPKKAALEVLAEINLRSKAPEKLKSAEKKNNWLIILLVILAVPVGIPFAAMVILIALGLSMLILAVFIGLVLMALSPLLILMAGTFEMRQIVFLFGCSFLGIGLLGLFLPLIPQAYHALSRWISKRVRIERAEA